MRIVRILSLSSAAVLVASTSGTATAQPADHPLARDRTGLTWTTPFTAARERAQREHRLLMIKPVAFGTTPDGGW